MRTGKIIGMKRRAILLLPFLAKPALAHSYKVGDIRIGHAWALPAQQAVDGQAFMPLLNIGKKPESLIAARSSIAGLIELRPYNRYDELPSKEFYLEPGKPLAMRPTAYHLRLIGLREALVVGHKFSLVLDFLEAGEIEISVDVETKPGT